MKNTLLIFALFVSGIIYSQGTVGPKPGGKGATGATGPQGATGATGPGGGANVQSVSVILTSTQVLNLGSAPVTLIPTPPAGQGVIVLGGFVNYTYGTMPYENLSDIQISYAISGTPICILGLSLTPSLTNTTYVLSIGDDISGSVILIGNESVIISSPGGSPTGGDGSFTFYVTYALVNL